MPPKKKTFKYWLLKFIFKIALLGLVICLLFITSIYIGLWGKIPTEKQLTEIQQSKATEVLSSNKRLLGKFYTTDRQPISYNQFPKHLIDALVATEDVRYFEHTGIDNMSMLRVLFKSILLQNKSSGGGSTLSQQLAKNMFPRKNLGKYGIIIHKIREIIISQRLEKVYTKKELLTHYLNTVPFSDNTFGIESASNKFFNVSAYELSLDQAAVLIGMLKTSYYYNPRLFPKSSKKRRNTVLQQMEKYNFIDAATSKKAQQRPLKLDYQSYSHNSGLAPYFRAQVKKDVLTWLKKYNQEHKTQLNLYNSGLKIYTTLDEQMQELAEKAIKKHLSILQTAFEKSYGKHAPWKKTTTELSKKLMKTPAYKSLKAQGFNTKEIAKKLLEPKDIELFTWNKKEVFKVSVLDSLKHYQKFLNTGFVALEPKTGAVKTWVGGINFEHFKYDHISQSKRQVGSTFKPIVYIAALENGYTACNYISNSTVSYQDLKGWTPTNASNSTNANKEYSLWSALSNSLNVISVKLLNAIGIETAINQAVKMGIESDLPNVPSLALGTAELSVLELAKAYTSIINNGHFSKPYYITKITDYQGNVLQKFEPKVSKTKAFSFETQQQITAMMQRVTNNGTAKRLRTKYGLKNDIASKTGTTQNNKDGWYVGLTPNLVSVCWVGTDDHSIGFNSTALGQGANSALPIFANWLTQLNANPDFNRYTKAKFGAKSMTISCPDSKNPNLIKQLFSKKDKIKKRTFNSSKKKKGFLSKLFSKK